MNLPRVSLLLNPADEPLLGRVPTHDETGRALSDLMLILPGFRDRPRVDVNRAIQDIHEILDGFAANVVFAEFNVSRNLLWITVRPVRGIRVSIAQAIRNKVPEARLVSHF